MYDITVTFIFTLLVVLVINIIGQVLILNKGMFLKRKTVFVLLVQSIFITILLGFVL
ncbi:hypothetical protein [Pseudalkalibacillus berkeleyi]|uniref:Uncharacterized protein n=1 Tax=Pseudalkalibacillus berkeleyi TaxID=1069813 RepID=A0ABS9GY58_9BACL|nr:hypothetical protein [Pseudalkalibacillus berkeleyi]MCF6136611.1 hypothetical protein [Pseudalkalibacillus berkeleyi]